MHFVDLSLIIGLLSVLSLVHAILTSMLHLCAPDLHQPPLMPTHQQVVLSLGNGVMLVSQTDHLLSLHYNYVWRLVTGRVHGLQRCH